MKYRSFLLVSTMILTLALAACSPQPTTTTLSAPTNTDSMPAMTSVPAATQAMTSAPTTSGSSVQVTIANFAFAPATLTVKVGTTVTWTNQDSAAHTVTSDTGVFDSGNLPQGKSFSYTFATAGTYPYHCTYHAKMIANVVVTN